MTAIFRSIAGKWRLHPKRIFLADGAGALLTAFLLAVVVAGFETKFGMPRKVLYSLSLVACLFCIYSFACYFFTPVRWQPWLKLIAIANLLYCCATVALVCWFYQRLTPLGLIYFLLEMAVILILVRFEWMIATHEAGAADAGRSGKETEGKL
jgi:hypothetical protein